MKTTQILAGISVATVLACVAPAYAGILGGGAAGGLGGALGGGMGNTGRLGGLSGQGEFDGQGFANTSVDRANDHRTLGTAKQAAATVDSTAKSSSTAGQSASSATGKDAAAATKPAAAKPAASNPAAATPETASPPSSRMNLMGTGAVDAQHSRGDTSVDASGNASGSVSKNPE